MYVFFAYLKNDTYRLHDILSYTLTDHSLVVVGRKCTFLWYDVMFARNRLGKGKPVGEGILSDSPGQYWGVQYDAYDCFVEVKFLPTEANTV